MFESRGDLAQVGAVVRAAVEPVVREGLDGLSSERLTRLTAECEALGRMVDALRLVAAGEIAERSRPELGDERLCRSLGCASPGEVLERLTGVSGVTARSRIRAGVALRARSTLTGEPLPPVFPLVSEAVMNGALGVDAGAAIVGALTPIRDRVGSGDDLDAAEAALVDAATGQDGAPPTPADEVRIMAQTWALYLDPDGALPDEERAMRERGLVRGRARGGVVRWTANLLPEVSAQLQTLLDAFLNPKVRRAPGPVFTINDDPDSSGDDDPGGGDRDGDLGGGAAPRDPRTPAQRAHDALAGILHVAAGMPGMPLLGGSPPTLVVTTTAADLADPRGVAFVPTHDGDDTGAVATTVARHAGCIGRVQKLVFGPEGQIVELGTTDRVFTGHRRRAIAIRDGGCVIPGCHVAAAWCEIHHVTESSRGGPTHTDNGVAMCWFHHRTLETSGWEVRMVRGAPWLRAPRWLDPHHRWRPAGGSPARRLTALAGAPPPGG